jgi:hypothetical protein
VLREIVIGGGYGNVRFINTAATLVMSLAASGVPAESIHVWGETPAAVAGLNAYDDLYFIGPSDGGHPLSILELKANCVWHEADDPTGGAYTAGVGRDGSRPWWLRRYVLLLFVYINHGSAGQLAKPGRDGGRFQMDDLFQFDKSAAKYFMSSRFIWSACQSGAWACRPGRCCRRTVRRWRRSCAERC